ncbi:hypothetical protein L596_009464 [Steinernema carpocapsae]|uniref:Uncharacterized protein n=1 Tax=Steinernema carpocapsae TaxID=34508 RepID=A0A4U5PFY3_STECR|nr:hypothetical protein L596_009464 [Steinernema carpocapsae]
MFAWDMRKDNLHFLTTLYGARLDHDEKRVDYALRVAYLNGNHTYELIGPHNACINVATVLGSTCKYARITDLILCDDRRSELGEP